MGSERAKPLHYADPTPEDITIIYMLSYTDLKPGSFFMLDGQPFVVLEAQMLRMQQRKPVMQTKIRNIISGKTLERNFQHSDSFEEAPLEKREVLYLYSHRGEYWFVDTEDKSKRFSLNDNQVGNARSFLKADTPVEALYFGEEVLNVSLPVKMDFRVTQAPPSVRGNTAQGGTKQVIIETGATINVPLFVNEGDFIRINTETGQYVERASKE